MPRYIDADKLKARMFNYYGCVNADTSKSNYRGETLMNYEVADMIEDCIDNAPTADVAEVKHGEWREHFAFGCWHYDCPFCEDGYATKEKDNTPPNYCQNCGAKMDGKKVE